MVLTSSESGVVAASVTGAFSWFNIERSSVFTLCCWYGSLLSAMTAVTVATQQFVALTRISMHVDGLARIRLVIGNGSEPSFSRLYAWQVPVMLLNISITLFIVGFAVLLVQTVPAEHRKVRARFNWIAAHTQTYPDHRLF